MSIASAGMISMYGAPVVGGMGGMEADWGGGGSWRGHGIFILNRFIHIQTHIFRHSS